MNTPESLTPDEQQAMQNELNGRCKDCRWWDGPAPEKSQVKCLLTISKADGMPVHFDSAAIAFANHFGCTGAALFTTADFGCIQWKAKDPS